LAAGWIDKSGNLWLCGGEDVLAIADGGKSNDPLGVSAVMSLNEENHRTRETACSSATGSETAWQHIRRGGGRINVAPTVFAGRDGKAGATDAGESRIEPGFQMGKCDFCEGEKECFGIGLIFTTER
jgi:hypothetical protein